MSLGGGLDLVTPPIAVRAGMASAGENYEPAKRGYVRSQGYERFDGRPAPSGATYHVLPYLFGTSAIEAGDVVAGGASGASGVALEREAAEVGALRLADVSGAFQPSEALFVGGAQVAVAEGVALLNGERDDEEDFRLTRLAVERRRALVGQPPGTGPIRGVATFRGDVLCWRDNISGTGATMFKATSSGWEEQSFGHHIAIRDASSEFLEGETVTGGASGATAVVRRVVLAVGAWDGEGRGRLILSDLAGEFQEGESLASSFGSATAASIAFNITFSAGGRYHTVEHNFYASEDRTRLYIANGVNRAMEWDGEVLALVATGIPFALDEPEHVAVHQGHLVLGYRNGSLQVSATGKPLTFNALEGATEIGFGHAVTGLLAEAKGSLIVTGRSRVAYLTGAAAADFALRSISDDSGALPHTLTTAPGPIYLDDRGLRSLGATEAYGDWSMGSITELVEPLLEARREAGLTPIGVLRVQTKDQVRLYWQDGAGLVVYLGRRTPQAMPLRLGFRPSCLAAGERPDGSQLLLVGSEDGWVYRLDAGADHDGAELTAFLRLAWDSQGAPNVMKRYHRVRLEGRSLGQRSRIGIGAEFGYAAEMPADRSEETLYGAGGAANEVQYGRVVWSAPAEGQATVDLDGMGENVAVLIVSQSVGEAPHALSALTIHHSPRRALR